MPPTNGPTRVEELIDAVRRQYVPDFRSGVFDVQWTERDDVLVLTGQSTHAGAVDELVRRLEQRGTAPRDEVVRLPDPLLGTHRHALVRAASAPIYNAPGLPAPQISQVVIGMRVELLSRDGDWVRIRAEDGYIGWIHDGALALGDDDWAFGWERGTAGEAVVSLGAELADEEGRVIARLPWGGRIVRRAGGLHLPDGRRGSIAHGEIVDVDRLADWFPPRGESVARTARRWFGAPYLWGGITLAGVDCSGFTQAVMWMHGIALPRDSDLQLRTGSNVDVSDGLAAVRAGDLLYFAEPGRRINHVAIALGGSLIIHSALSNGGVDINDLNGAAPLEAKLRAMLVAARRMLPD